MKRAERMTRDLQPRQKHYEADVKFRILHLLERGYMPPEEIAESFGISARTPYDWRDAYDEAGMAWLEDAPGSGRPALVSADGIRDAVESVSGRGMVTVRDVQAEISETHGIKYCGGRAWIRMRRMKMTYKKADPVHGRAATNEEWAGGNMPVIESHLAKGYVLLSVDGPHPEIDGVFQYGYAESGQRVCTSRVTAPSGGST